MARVRHEQRAAFRVELGERTHDAEVAFGDQLRERDAVAARLSHEAVLDAGVAMGDQNGRHAVEIRILN